MGLLFSKPYNGLPPPIHVGAQAVIAGPVNNVSPGELSVDDPPEVILPVKVRFKQQMDKEFGEVLKKYIGDISNDSNLEKKIEKILNLQLKKKEISLHQQIIEKENLLESEQKLSQYINGLRDNLNCDDNLCCICNDKIRNMVLIPCGHINMCEDCSKIYGLNKPCPLCRTQIKSTQKTYF